MEIHSTAPWNTQTQLHGANPLVFSLSPPRGHMTCPGFSASSPGPSTWHLPFALYPPPPDGTQVLPRPASTSSKQPSSPTALPRLGPPPPQSPPDTTVSPDMPRPLPTKPHSWCCLENRPILRSPPQRLSPPGCSEGLFPQGFPPTLLHTHLWESGERSFRDTRVSCLPLGHPAPARGRRSVSIWWVWASEWRWNQPFPSRTLYFMEVPTDPLEESLVSVHASGENDSTFQCPTLGILTQGQQGLCCPEIADAHLPQTPQKVMHTCPVPGPNAKN